MMDALYFKLKTTSIIMRFKKKTYEIYNLNFISLNKHKNKTNVE